MVQTSADSAMLKGLGVGSIKESGVKTDRDMRDATDDKVDRWGKGNME